MSILSSAEISDIVSEIRGIVGDDSISTTITYKLSGTTVDDFDPTSGLIPDMYASSSVSAFKGSYSAEEIAIENRFREELDKIELGDVKFIIMASDVSAVLSTDDKIYEAAPSVYQSATTYEIISVKRDPLDICQFIQARSI